MNNVFSNLLDVCVVVYLDDILIYSDDIVQHQSHIKEVLKQLCKSGLYAERVQKGIAYWDKQNYAVPAPNCMLKVWGEIIKDEGL